jgi:hypothetical protein
LIGVALGVAYVIEDALTFDVPEIARPVAENLSLGRFKRLKMPMR